MSRDANKRLVQQIYADSADRSGTTFVDNLADDACWVVTGSTQYGRAFADPKEVPQALKYYDELKRRADLVYDSKPYGSTVPFSFDYSFNSYPRSYTRPGPEIQIYRLKGCNP